MGRAPPTASPRRHILTINLEDYFQVGPLSSAVPQRYWPRFQMRVEQSTLETLAILDECGAKATFFVVGWIAEHCGELLREVCRRGHEVASKGFYHRSLGQMPPEDFRDDALHSRDVLEAACGQGVQGYRIAQGWLAPANLWALDILAKEGFTYDSSLLPRSLIWNWAPEWRVVHKHRTREAGIWELPISSWTFGGFALPISGGNYVRQLPHAFIRKRLESWDVNVEAPIVFYFHTWELDPGQPRIAAISQLRRIRQYRNLERMPDRIRHYLSSYRFTSVNDYLGLDRTSVAREDPGPILFHQDRAVTSPGRAVTIVVPCHNEEATLPYLAKTLDRFAEYTRDRLELSLVLVDDGSTDGTAAKLKELFGDRSNCRIVAHDSNRGVGAATMTGLRNAMTEVVCAIDCDCSYDIEQLEQMIRMLEDDVDLVTASPYHREGTVVNVPRWRLFLSRSLSAIYGQVLRHKLATYTACFRVYRRSAVADLEITRGDFIGITEILVSMDRRGARIVECPAVLESRLFGVSKMKTLRAVVGHLSFLSDLLRNRLPASEDGRDGGFPGSGRRRLTRRARVEAVWGSRE